MNITESKTNLIEYREINLFNVEKFDKTDETAKRAIAHLSIPQQPKSKRAVSGRQILQLRAACLDGNISRVEKLIKIIESRNWIFRGIDFSREILGRALLGACDCRDHAKGLEIIQYLIGKGADPGINQFVSEGLVPLHVAKDPKIISLLIDAGAIVDMRNAEGQTPLMLACRFGDLRAVSTLLERGANPSLMSPLGVSPLFFAIELAIIEKATNAENGQGVKIVRELIRRGANIESQLDGRTTLMWACNEGHLELARLLIDLGANPLARSLEDGFTPFLYLCVQPFLGSSQLAESFKPFIKNLNVDPKTKLIPLFLAIGANNLEMVKWLFENGADFKIRGQSGLSPLELARGINPQSDVSKYLEKCERLERGCR